MDDCMLTYSQNKLKGVMFMNNVKIVKVKDANGRIKTFTVNADGKVVDQNGTSVPLNFANQKEASNWAKKSGANYESVTLGF